MLIFISGGVCQKILYNFSAPLNQKCIKTSSLKVWVSLQLIEMSNLLRELTEHKLFSEKCTKSILTGE